ncbi:MAG TPA: cytochrome c1 [Steroidobacteraceae bacterium]|nr:cytochrome c1 [Steroidobacteraceae bacterium]
MPIKFAGVVGGLALLLGAGAVSANEGGHAGWQRAADNEIANRPSLQRGARHFMDYCSGCHSLKYMRYSRVAEDLKIPDNFRDTYLVRPGEKFSDYIKASMPAADAQEWFGKPPPDLSLVARSRGSDWVFNFLTTFYADSASRQTGVNNLQLPGTAMPHVLASVQGVQQAVWNAVEHKGEDGKAVVTPEFKEFAPGVVGSLTPAQYDEFARDIVNFLQYVSDPSQVERQSIGIWVVLFLLMFTGIAYMLKKEYWKDVR